ncbi:MAG: succinylglutamate desuccinylase/aspartoacylase family protein [Acidobacteria bacterium]|nr:succinylglutamate desuccinylase/aspartoacylase family protein [Acidobacteriota bacterium]MCW5947934.1 succinylglutamate desuccinylase/aspartoacylase family protein [Pyrinomonadaceae bacterium]
MDNFGASKDDPLVEPGEHVIGAFVGDPAGPTLIVVGSVHGNEPAGLIAIKWVAEQMPGIEKHLKGRLFLIAGNSRALGDRVRFIDQDLNRAWTADEFSARPRSDPSSEHLELTELVQIFDSILIKSSDEVFILDLHSTSASGVPFATVGDTLRNRDFAMRFPVTVLLGIEEQLDGTMLEHFNELGAVTLGFEGGSHGSPDTVNNHESMIWAALAHAGLLDPVHIPDADRHFARLGEIATGPRIVEVRYRHAISATDGFEMDPGYNNFDEVTKGERVGVDKNGAVHAPETGLMLMPLYQRLGTDGFFIGRKVAPFWLWLSAILRKIGVQRMVHWLPGVTQTPGDPERLIVNTRVARLFPLQIFHLLGYRRRRWDGDKLIVRRRRHDTVSPFRRN